MSAFPFPRAYRRPACGAIAALGLGLRLWAQAPAAASTGSGWQLSAQLNEGVDSNVTFAFQHPQADSTTTLNLTLGRRWVGPRYSFVASYTPEGVNYASHPKLDYISQSYQQVWTYALGQHTQLTWSGTAQRYPQRGGVPQAGGMSLLTTANASQALGAQMVLTTAGTILGLSHQYSARGSWTLGANGTWQSFQPDASLASAGATSALSLAQAASTSRSGGGSAGWNYELTPARTIGITASDTELWFTAPRQRLRYDSVQLAFSQRIGPYLNLSFGGGPAWNMTVAAPAGPAAARNTHNYAGSASLAAQAGSVSYALSWQHSEQLGLAPGSLTTDSIALNANWRVDREWSAGASVGRSGGTGLGTGASRGNLDSVFAAAQIGWSLAPGWSLLANATYSTETLPLAPGAPSQFQHLQASLGLTYTSGGAQ